MEKTQNGFKLITDLIEEEKKQTRVFPYTTRELATMTGMSNGTVSLFLHKCGLTTKGHLWVYRNIQEREHE